MSTEKIEFLAPSLVNCTSPRSPIKGLTWLGPDVRVSELLRAAWNRLGLSGELENIIHGLLSGKWKREIVASALVSLIRRVCCEAYVPPTKVPVRRSRRFIYEK
jgi:hypothetical protein